MANLTINDLSAASALAGADLFPVWQGGATKKATLTQVLAGVGSASLTGIRGALATTDVISLGVTGDAFDRVVINADGSMLYGDGTYAPDAMLRLDDFNSSAGSFALASRTTGNANSAFGNNAMYALTDGDQNVGVGHFALVSLIGGDNNTAVGWSALDDTTTGLRQTAVGAGSGQNSATQRNDIVCLGYAAVVDGDNAIAIGSGASAGAAGAVAIGRDSAGTPATTTTANEIKMGTATQTFNVIGNAKVAGSGKTLGFYGVTAITKPTGVAVTAAGIHAALVSLGLIAA